MKLIRLYIYLLPMVIVLLLSGNSLDAQDRLYDIQLSDSITEYDFVLSKLHAFVDTTNQKTFGEILKNQEQFKIDPKYTKNDYDINSTYWVRLGIRHNPKSKRKWVLNSMTRL